MKVDELLKKAEVHLDPAKGGFVDDRYSRPLRGIGYALMAIVLAIREKKEKQQSHSS